jgi:hypothetical protein
MQTFLHALTAGVQVPVVVGGPFAREHQARVSASGARFGETAEEVMKAVARVPVFRAR